MKTKKNKKTEIATSETQVAWTLSKTRIIAVHLTDKKTGRIQPSFLINRTEAAILVKSLISALLHT